jgi:ribonuclease HI
MNESLIYIYADESCLGNQYMDRDSPGGAAGLVEHWRGEQWERRDYWISEPGTTNNRMALRSAIEGLSLLRRPCSVVFTSDSQYLVRGMTEWVHGWMARGWKRKAGVIENLELWKALVEAARRHQVEWRWVRGHAGHPQNEYANILAIAAARGQTDSGGLQPSGFEAWLARERDERNRYFDHVEHAPPRAETFRPATPGRDR